MWYWQSWQLLVQLDVSDIGFWRPPQEKSVVDVRVFEPNCATYRDLSLAQTYKTHENQKKSEYGERVNNIERGLLTPLFFSTSGRWSIETTKFHRQIAALWAKKRGEEYSLVMTYIRRRLRFSLLESLRGSWIKRAEVVLRPKGM